MRTLSCMLLTSLVALSAVTPSQATAKPGDRPFCGTYEVNLFVAEARHDFFQRQLALKRQAGEIPLKSAPTVSQAGQIVILDDDGTVTTPPKPFDLAGRAIQYLRRPRGMSTVRSPLRFKQLIGNKLQLGDDDSIQVDFPAGFRFPFGDRVYDSVFVNSNGNLTFGASDPSGTTNLNLLVSGPPRIAALYKDLNPLVATGANGVYVNFLPGRVRVTWLGVPEFLTTNENTVQVTLFTNGKVNIAFGDVDAIDPIVGVAPFLAPDLFVLDYDQELPLSPRRATIAEQFTEFPTIDEVEAVRVFTENFADVYDSVFIWNDFPGIHPARASQVTIQNDIRGIGQEIFDRSFLFPASPKLESYIEMGNLSQYPDDPDEVIGLVGGTRTQVSGTTVLAHQFGHRWLAFARLTDEGGQPSFDLLNIQSGSHWGNHIQSNGSVMYGNFWTDNGDGTFTSTPGQTQTSYSPLDRYLMGLASAASVPDFFYIDGDVLRNTAPSPTIVVTASGQRVDVSLDQIIAAEGPRRPSRVDSPNSFRTAFLLVGRGGQSVSQNAIDKLEAYRQRWMSYFPEATGNRGTVRTAIIPR